METPRRRFAATVGGAWSRLPRAGASRYAPHYGGTAPSRELPGCRVYTAEVAWPGRAHFGTAVSMVPRVVLDPGLQTVQRL